MAPTVAVRGNMDFGEWAHRLPRFDRIDIGQLAIVVIHDLYHLAIEPQLGDISVVISGHTHQPLARKKKGVLYLNPGSSSQARYGSPASVAVLKIRQGRLKARFIDL